MATSEAAVAAVLTANAARHVSWMRVACGNHGMGHHPVLFLSMAILPVAKQKKKKLTNCSFMQSVSGKLIGN